MEGVAGDFTDAELKVILDKINASLSREELISRVVQLIGEKNEIVFEYVMQRYKNQVAEKQRLQQEYDKLKEENSQLRQRLEEWNDSIGQCNEASDQFVSLFNKYRVHLWRGEKGRPSKMTDLNTKLQEALPIEKIMDSIESFNKLEVADKFMLLVVNVQGLKTNIGKLRHLISSLNGKPHVIICTETRQAFQNVSLHNYRCYYRFGRKTSAEGIVLYIRKNIRATKITYNSEDVQDLTLISFDIMGRNSSIKITGLYRTPNLKYRKSEFIQNLTNLLKYHENDENHFIAGDFNVDILTLDNDGHDHLLNLMKYKYKPLFNKITCPPKNYGKNYGSCIDNVFAKTEMDIVSYKIVRSIADHYTLITALDFQCESEMVENT